MIVTLSILLISVILFVSGKVRSDLVALCVMLALVVCQILTTEEALSGFSNSTVIMMVGLFIVGGGIFHTGLAKMISSRILKLAGGSETRLFLLVVLTTAGIGAFVSNTGTVALMMPIVVSMAASANSSSGRLLMPLAFASSMGGMMTLIGTPPNLIVSDTLAEAGFGSLSFFSFLPVGILCVAVGTLVLLPLSKWFLSGKGTAGRRRDSGKTLGQLVNEYSLSRNLFRAMAGQSSTICGKTLAELDVRQKYGINILEIRRNGNVQGRFMNTVRQISSPNTPIEANDILYLSGKPEQIESFVSDCSLTILDPHSSEETGTGDAARLDFYDIGIAEVLLMSSSRLNNLTVKDAGFREKFSLNVLGIRRKNDYLLHDLGEVRMHDGDVLLVQGNWKDIARLSEEDEQWVVLGQPLQQAARVTLDYKAPIAALIMAAMIAAMVFDIVPAVAAVLIAAVLMVLTGCVRNMEAAYKTINWETIVLFGAMMPMSLALEKTGVSELMSGFLASSLGALGPLALLAGIYFTTSLMTMFISNTVTALLMASIALQSAIQIEASPVPFLFAVTVGASMCFASPFSTPPNALVMSAGQYSFMDYIKVGLPLQIIMGVVMVLVLPLIFPF